MRVMIWGPDWGRELELTDAEWELLKKILMLMDAEGQGEGIRVDILTGD